MPAIEQLPLPAVIRLGLDKLAFSGYKAGLRRAKSILLVLRVKTSQELACLHPVANIHESLNHATADSK